MQQTQTEFLMNETIITQMVCKRGFS